jgi:hypothetical protein
LAIAIDQRFPEVREALGSPLEGEGIGQPDSLAQCLSRELVVRAGKNPAYPAQIGFMSHVNVEAICFRSHPGSGVESRLTRPRYDLSMFRRAKPLAFAPDEIVGT